MLRLKPIQPIAKQMKDQKEIADDENRIDRQFDSKSSQTLGSSLFHQVVDALPLNVSAASDGCVQSP
jgi:hypothetical protein